MVPACRFAAKPGADHLRWLRRAPDPLHTRRWSTGRLGRPQPAV